MNSLSRGPHQDYIDVRRPAKLIRLTPAPPYLTAMEMKISAGGGSPDSDKRTYRSGVKITPNKRSLLVSVECPILPDFIMAK